MDRNILSGDIIAKIDFLSTDKGGRASAICHDTFGCLFFINNEYWDCRLLLKDISSISPGQQVILPIKFLNIEKVKRYLSQGLKFQLWDGKIIANGIIIQTLF